MMRMISIALAQTRPCVAPSESLKVASESIAAASVRSRPDLIVFPELFMSHETARGADRLGEHQPLDGPFVHGMRELAQKCGAWLAFGMLESPKDDADDRPFNTSLIIGSDGEIAGACRKTHLYDAFGSRESEMIRPGDALFRPIRTPIGVLGMFVCYELRFPEVARSQALMGAEITIVPAAWAKGGLKSAHLRTLAASRAIENTMFIALCDESGPASIGESALYDPMGVATAAGGADDCVISCTIDLDSISAARTKLPSLVGRRTDLYIS